MAVRLTPPRPVPETAPMPDRFCDLVAASQMSGFSAGSGPGARILRAALAPMCSPIVKLPELNFIDDKAGKPVGIHQHIGRRPIFAAGNSDGDFQMLEWTTSGEGPRFGMLVHHDDAEREFAYDRESHVGKLNKGLDEGPARGWTILSMQKDWKTIFP